MVASSGPPGLPEGEGWRTIGQDRERAQLPRSHRSLSGLFLQPSCGGDQSGRERSRRMSLRRNRPRR